MLGQATLRPPVSEVVGPGDDRTDDSFHEELWDGVLSGVGGGGVRDADEGIEEGLVGGGRGRGGGVGGPVRLHVGVDETCF